MTCLLVDLLKQLFQLSRGYFHEKHSQESLEQYHQKKIYPSFLMMMLARQECVI